MDPPLKPKDGTSSVLESIPVEALAEILDRCDYPSIQSLRKTNSKIRDFIDTQLPKCSILKLLITILLDTVVLQIHVSNSDLPYPAGGLLYLTYKRDEETSGAKFSYDVKDYLHLKRVHTELSVISWRNMDTLKKNILSERPEKHFRLNYNHFHDRDQFPRHFGAHLKDDDENAFFFFRTNKDEQLLKMSIFGNFIEFKWISPHEMPLEGLPFIQEYQIPEKKDYWKFLRDLRYIF
ncbi:hypothetical protein L5515_009649 [Caenorhabditis briggsae]|uniref:F-box domain-containing protein n=1 Tax=Caenorhabditis briggsae TaxID=6238 RepID=A0AAE9F9E0_CAEBR|nr:hypothetical protein L5515_009649 [Caenorhabditis briggsae]